jgi:LysR family glycine cleavage system transcriptional activator
MNQLRAFEAAARHLSFKDAAHELNVTHSAVSHQVKALEEFLGAQLFQRIPRGVQLTAEAKALSLDLTKALDRMGFVVNRFMASEMTGTLRISVVPWYGNRFLVPNLPKFRAANPGLDIELEFSYELIDFQNDDFHAALRHGNGNWDKLSAYRIHNDYVSPVCAPELVAGLDLPLSPDQISRMVLAVARGYEGNWRSWLSRAGVENNFEPQFMHFDNQALAIEFSLAGNGVTLSDLQSLHDELHSGQLVRLHPQAISLQSGLHLAFPETPYPDSRLLRVVEWIKEILPTSQELE